MGSKSTRASDFRLPIALSVPAFSKGLDWNKTSGRASNFVLPGSLINNLNEVGSVVRILILEILMSKVRKSSQI